jgi:hypothetical protein
MSPVMLLAACGGVPSTLKDLPSKSLAIVATYDAATVNLGYVYEGDGCPTLSTLQARLNGTPLVVESYGSRGQYDHDEGSYHCIAPWFSLHQHIEPDPDGKYDLVIWDNSETVTAAVPNSMVSRSVSLRGSPGPTLHHLDELILDFNPPEIGSGHVYFVDPQENISGTVALLDIEGGSAHFHVPASLSGTWTLFASWQVFGPSSFTRCVGSVDCWVSISGRAALGTFQIVP